MDFNQRFVAWMSELLGWIALILATICFAIIAWYGFAGYILSELPMSELGRRITAIPLAIFASFVFWGFMREVAIRR